MTSVYKYDIGVRIEKTTRRWPSTSEKRSRFESLVDDAIHPVRLAGSSVSPPDVLNETGVRAVRSGIMNGMKIIRNIIVIFALSAVAVATSACPDKGPAEKAGEKIDDAIDKTKDAAEDATK